MLEVHSSLRELADHSVFSIRKTEKYEFYIVPVSDTLIIIVRHLKGMESECPACKTPDLLMTGRQGIEIDYSPQQREPRKRRKSLFGEWFDFD
jgi:hypothetical protein